MALPFVATILHLRGGGLPLTWKAALSSHAFTPLLWLIDITAIVLVLLMLIGILREQKQSQRVSELQDKIAQRIGELYNLKDIYHREIHQRQQAEINITRAKREWEITFDAIPDLVLLTDSHGKIMRCNQATIQKLECTYADLLGKPIEEVFPGVVEPIQKRVINKTQVIPMPSRYGWFDVTGFQYQFLEEKPGMIYIFHDIAERKSSEAELQRQKQYFEALFQNNPVAIVTLNLSNRIVTSNPAFEYLFGYSPPEAAGRKLDELILPPEYQSRTIEYTRRIHRLDVHHEVSRRLTKRGETLDVEIFTVPVVVNNQPLGTLVLFHNITDLVQARKKAEDADIAKSAFLANVSHEIRTPLNGLIGLLNMTLDTSLSLTQNEYLSAAADQAEELVSLLNEILDLSKIEAGRMQLEIIPFELRTVMENVALTMAQRASDKGIDLICLIPPTVPTKLRGDPNRLRQVLSNLTTNAVKFTDQGEVVLRVQLESDDGYVSRLNFSVQDTGIGIPVDRQAAIFERFTQADQSTSRIYGGTGLGLSISAQIVELMGGKITLESEPGAGSIFSFSVSFEKVEENDPPSEALLEHSRGLKVLIVDQNPHHCQNLHHLFEEIGCQSHTAASEEDALALIELAGSGGEPFQLIAVDARLAGEDDYAFLHRIQVLSLDRVPKLIAFNRLGDTIDEVMLGELGVGGIGLKPVRRQPLHNMVYDVLSHGQTSIEVLPESRIINWAQGLKAAIPQKILLAEDNPTNRKVVINLLEKFGHSVHAVENGRQAIAALSIDGYNLVLMDVTMPELNGQEAVSRIRKVEGLDHHTPVIALTGHTSDSEVQRCLASGMDACLFKPVRPKELFDAVEKWAAPIPENRPWLIREAVVEETSQASEPQAESQLNQTGDEEAFAEFTATIDLTILTESISTSDGLSPESQPGEVPALDDNLEIGTIALSQHPFGSRDYLENILPRFGNDPAFFITTFEEFIIECRSHLDGLRQAIEEQDAAELRLVAHNLKGLAANFEVADLTNMSYDLENQGAHGNFLQAQELVDSMEEIIPGLEAYLVEICRPL